MFFILREDNQIINKKRIFNRHIGIYFYRNMHNVGFFYVNSQVGISRKTG